MQEGTPLPLELPGEDLFPNDAGIWTIPSQSPLVASVFAGSLDHRGIPCLGYVINEIDTPGSLDAGKVRVGCSSRTGGVKTDAPQPILMKNKEALAKTGVKNPMALMARIKSGEVLTMPDGSVVDPSTAIGRSKPGRKVVILGDTSNSDAMLDVAGELPVDDGALHVADIEQLAVTCSCTRLLTLRFHQSSNRLKTCVSWR